MTDGNLREPTWDALENYLRAKGWSGRWITPKLGRWQPPLGGPLLHIDTSEHPIGIVIVHIADREGRPAGDVRRDIINGIPAEKATPEPSDAEEK